MGSLEGRSSVVDVCDNDEDAVHATLSPAKTRLVALPTSRLTKCSLEITLPQNRTHIMDEDERTELTEQSVFLRQELKVWERQFATANDGRKAGREDIKQNPHIGMLLYFSNTLRNLTLPRSSKV